MKKLFLFMVSILALSSIGFAQSPGETQTVGRSSGTVLRTWLANTKTEWEPTTTTWDVRPGERVKWSGTVVVDRVQTNYFRHEVVTQAAFRKWEVVGRTTVTERDPTCENLRALDPPEQKRECPLLPVDKEVYGWNSYPEQTGEEDAGSERSIVQKQPIRLSVDLSGQVLRDYEKESLSVTVDENAGVEAAVNNSLNIYEVAASTVSPQSATVVARGKGRNLSLENGAIPGAGIFADGRAPVVYQSSQNPNRLYLKFQTNKKVFDTEFDPNIRLKVTYQIEQTDGKSAQDRDNYKKAQSRTMVIDPRTQNDFEIDLWGAGRGRWVRAHVWFNLVDSRWYSERSYDTGANATFAQ